MPNTHVSINSDKCLKDDICVSVCPCGIFQSSELGFPKIDTKLTGTCIKCGHCISSCPGDAITVSGLNITDFQPVQANLPVFNVLDNLVKSRRSIRNFKDRQVEKEKISKLLELTRYCPTAKNTQNLSWVVIDGPEKVRAFSAAVIDVFRASGNMAEAVNAFDHGKDPIHRGAPMVVIACAPEKYPWGTMDATIAMTSFELAAKAEGLGTCWAGFSTWAAASSKDVGRSIGLDDTDKIYAAMMVGYPKFSYHVVPPRKPLKLRIISQ